MPLDLTIKEMVKLDLIIPDTPSVFDEAIDAYTRKWQLHLGDSLEIPAEDLYNETEWPPKANVLIAKLIVYEFIQRNQVSNTTIQTGSGGSTTGAGLKKIKTGPSEAEWYNASESWRIWEKEGAIDNYRMEICIYASQLGIRFWFCPPMRGTTLFIVGKKRKPHCGC